MGGTQSAENAGTGAQEFETVRELRLKLQYCQEESMKLQSVIAELTQVNKRWQKYNSDRQVYVQKLLDIIQDQQEQLNLIGERSCTASGSADPHTHSNLKPQVQNEAASSVSEHAVNPAEVQLERLQEQVSVLEFQVKANRDDWEAELSEKRQALQDKEAAERKVEELITELRLLSCRDTGDQGEVRFELYCQNCGRIAEFDHSQPSRSRIYRTAVHLPCSSSQQSSTTSISSTSEDLVIDSRGLQLRDLERDLRRLNIKSEETSYSRSSTVPLASGLSKQTSAVSDSSNTQSSTSSININSSPVTIKSYVQIPIAKSSSVPEGCSSKFSESARMSLDSFKTSNVPPVSIVTSPNLFDGNETLSAENVICLRCGVVFLPGQHLQFLDHFPKCQSSRNYKMVSRNGASNI